MIQGYKLTCLLTMLLFCSWLAQAQVFPVSTSLQTIPPHSSSLADLVAPASNKMSLTLNLNDAEELSYQVKLKVTIEGNGITLTTKNNVNFTPIDLAFGSPVILQGVDLQEYFDPAAFNFNGYSITDYLTQGGLPDGFYTICVEAYDYVRSNEGAASSPACAMINATLLDAPVVLSPVGMQTTLDPQYLTILWQNLHDVPIPVEHEIEIYTWPYNSSLSPNQVIQFDLPFFSTTLMSTTSYILTGADPPLTQGERYLIQVKASDLSGSYIFKNQGWSELQVFTYGDQCPAPTDVAVDNVETDEIGLSWASPNTDFNSYIVRYREQLEGANWYEDEVVLLDHTIVDLTPNTTYEIQVQTLCGGSLPGLLSPVIEVKTDSLLFDPSTYDCGDAATFPQPTNITPIAANQLAPGDYISIAGFSVKIMTISAGTAANSFSGSCHVDVGWLGQKFYAKFKNLYINTDKEVYDGNIICKSKGLNKLPGFISPDSIAKLRNIEEPRDFCGNLKTGIKQFKSKHEPDIYATLNTGSYSFFIPTNAGVIDTSAFYDPYNPTNPRRPYDPSDYSDPNNPYTAENAYVADNLWNPYNPYNPYNPRDYTDPANPYTPANPYDPTRLHTTNGAACSGAIAGGDEVGAQVLPFGLTRMGGSGKNYMIALDKMKFTTKGAILNAYISLDLPKKGGGKTYASFQLKGAQFHPGGLVGESKLVLNNNVSVAIGSKSEVTFEKGKFSYVSWDCDGFKSVSVKGHVRFCRDVMLPIDWAKKQIDDSTYVTAHFYATMPEWGEFVADVSMSPFEVPDLEDWVFVVQNAVFDFSDNLTPNSVLFPKNYTHPDVNSNSSNAVTGAGSPAWTGFYLKALRVRLPKKFKKKKSLQDMTPEDVFNPALFDEPDEDDDDWANRVALATADPNQLEIGAENVIIDQTGLTAYVYGSNILKLEEGKVGTWAFAIDSVGIGIQSNQFHTAYLKGKVDIPALKHKLGYVGLVQPAGQYLFQISIQDTLSVSALSAKLDLFPNSSFTISYNNSKSRFEAGCKLNGYASFNASMSSDTAAQADQSKDRFKLPNVRFQNFEILSYIPYLKIGTWALDADDPAAANFPLTINQFGIFQNSRKDKVAILVDAAVNFTPSGDMGIGANGQLAIVFDVTVDTIEQQQKWVFEKVKVGKLGIDASGPGFKFKGSIQFYENKPVYGSGFRGSIQAEFTPKISVGVVAQFGEVDGFRYAMADALVAFDPGIALGQTGLALYGLGGGFSYKMKRTGFSSIKLPPPTTPPAAPPADPSGPTGPPPGEMIIPSWLFDDPPPRPSTPAPPLPPDGSTPVAPVYPNSVPIDERIGYSLSGTQYIPDVNMGVGIKATIALGAVKRELFHGSLTFEIIFNASGGVHQIGFDGDLAFLTIPNLPGEPPNLPQIRAQISMLYDFPAKSFHANMDMYVNAIEGTLIGAYQGGSLGYLAGSAIFHADTAGWYLNIGTPSKPIKVSLDVLAFDGLQKDKKQTGLDGGEGSGSSSTTDADTTAQGTPLVTLGEMGIMLSAYLCAGTELPAFPNLPYQVQSVIGNGYNITARDDPAFSNGGGILFGAQFSAEMSDMKFLIFFADFYGGMGFDVGLINYGPDAMCAGDPSSAPIGIEGWYAQGQMYAYILGTIGIYVKVFGVEGQFPIIDLGLAAALQARLPEPWWLRGVVGGNFSILNGLVEGSCSFEFEVGEQCEIVSSLEPPSPTANIISAVWPNDDDTDVDVFTTPQATFSVPIGKSFYFDNGSGTAAYYKAELLDLNLKKITSSGSTEAVVTTTWNSRNDVAALNPRDILNPQSDYEFTVKVVFKTRASQSDAWVNLYDDDGNLQMESKTVSFTSGDAPTTIEKHRVEYSYPIFNQLHFLQDESSSGYIKLKQGMPYLFKDQGEDFYLDPSEWNQKLVFMQNGSQVAESAFTYNAAEKQVNFAISGGLANNTITSVQLVNIPIVDADAVDANVDSIMTAYVMGGVSDSMATVNIKQKEIQGARSELKSEAFFTLHCRTSAYNTWTQKVASFDLSEQYSEPYWIYPPPSSVTIPIVGATLAASEKLDKAEFIGYHNGNTQLGPLVGIEANLDVTGGNWFDGVNDTMYQYVPNEDFPLTRRNPAVLGVPPSKAISIFVPGNQAQELTASDISNNSVTLASYQTRFKYKVGIESKLDFNYLFTDIAAAYPNGTPTADIPDEYETLLNWFVPQLYSGNYEVNLNYTLPGKTVPSSSVTATFIVND